MGSKKLLIAAVLLAALSGLVWWAKRHPKSTESTSTSPTNPNVVNIPDSSVQSIDLQKKGGPQVTLQLQNGKWAITAPEPFTADQDAAKSIASSLSPVASDGVVEDKPANLSKYGLTSPSLTVTIHQKGGKSNQLFFGDDVPAGSDVYARLNGDPKVYALSTSVKNSFDKTVNDLRDKRLLTFDQNQLSRIEIDGPKAADVEFGKNGQNDWTILKPGPYRADNFQVEDLLRKLTDAKMDLSSATDDAKKAVAAYTAGQPVATAKLSDSGGTQTLEVRKNKDDYYAKSSVVNGTFKVSTDLGKALEKPVDDYRNKKIFDFGFAADPNKLEIQQGSSDKSFVKSGADWTQGVKKLDAGDIQGLIDKLRELSASQFVTAGFTAPDITITVISSDGKRTEKAEFSKSANGYIVRRGSEPALYQLDAKAVNDILEASKSIKPAAAEKK
jgi:hypothetical protein